MNEYETYKRTVLNHPILSKREERVLIAAAQAGDVSARDRFLAHNMRLVFFQVAKFRGSDLPEPDRFSEGYIGLRHALDLFDLDRDLKFSTYAVAWIRQFIQRAIDNQSLSIRPSVDVLTKARRINRHETELAAALGRQPTVREVAEMLDLPVKHVDAHRVEKATSLNKPMGESGVEMIEIIPDSRKTPEELMMADSSNVLAVIDECLSPKLSLIVRLRLGLDGEREHTLRELGELLGMSPQAVQQNEITAYGILGYVKEQWV